MSQAPFDPFDPVNMAMRALHQGNLNAAKDARIKQLEERLETLREAGDALGMFAALVAAEREVIRQL